jgi:cytosol alanyl aminopeptidase
MRQIALLLCSFFINAIQAQTGPPKLRLGTTVQPIRYTADLTVNPKQDDFHGDMTIVLQIAEPVSTFWLNAADLQIQKVELDAGGKTKSARIVLGGEDFVGFSFDEPIAVGRARLKLRYSGKVNRKSSAGLFGNSAPNEAYLFTQFEPLDARRVFPCFDEPSFKVPWQLILRVPKEDQAFSNTPVLSEKEEGDTRVVTFGETKPLASYLVAFAVGPLEIVEAGKAGSNKVPVRIIVPKGSRDQAQYAASVTAEILTRLEHYFGIPYPYEKADSIAIPLSFGGAMENPGLITYDQDIILAKPDQDSPQRQRTYAQIAIHELAHQWFGNLVTMAWWNDTWLNEAFATWMEQKLTAEWKPEWQTRVADQEQRLFAMSQDSLVSARRINQPAETKSDIANAFDGITYTKGGAVLRMFESAMGEQKFRSGVQAYLKQYTFRNARAEDFLAALSKAGGAEIAPAFATFLNQAGVPELSVRLKCEGTRKPLLQVKQERSLPIGSAGSRDQTWSIPVCVEYGASGKRLRQCSFVKAASAEIELKDAPGCPDWVLPNAGETGYYRVKYEGDLLTRLLKNNREQLSLPEQVGLLGDVVALTNSGNLPAQDALAIVPTIKDDPHRQIARAAVRIVENLTQPNRLPPELRSNRLRFIQQMFGDRARKLGWVAKPNESEDERLLRPDLVSFVAINGDDQILIASAKELAQRWVSDRSAVTSDVAGPLLRSAARSGDVKLYEQLFEAAKREKDPRDKRTMIEGLAGFRNAALLQRNFSYLIDGTFDPRESNALLFAPMGEPVTSRAPLEFVMSRYDEVVAKLPAEGIFTLASFLPNVARVGCSERERAQTEAFFKLRVEKITGAPRNLANVLESIHLCEARMQAQSAGVAEFLRRY